MFDFCLYYWQTCSSFQAKKKVKVITPSKYCVQAHLFLIKNEYQFNCK